MSSDRDRRGSRPGAPPPKPDVPWLKDRPDLHRSDEDTTVLPRPEPPTSEEPAPPPAKDRPADQRVPGSRARREPEQSGEPASPQGDATKARRRPS